MHQTFAKIHGEEIRYGSFGADFTKEVRHLDIEEVLSAPRSPWQRASIERVIGSIR
jgi:transposase InsO family protein